MIKRYIDHSANERTYLAWIRTAISIMAFGFIIEKFDLFISYLSQEMDNKSPIQSFLSPEIAGLLFFIVGVLIVIAATVRFFTYKKSIESDESIPYNVKKTNILLSTLIILISLFIMIYLIHNVVK